MDVGREIRRLREAKGWSQAKLAGAADMGVSGISQIETGARNPSAVTLAKIAAALGVGVGELFPKAQAPLPLEEISEAGRPDNDLSIFDVVHEAIYAQTRKDAQAFRRVKESGLPQRLSRDYEGEAHQFLLSNPPERVAAAYSRLMQQYLSLEGKLEQLQARLQERERVG